MPFEKPSFKANGSIRVARFVKIDSSADNVVLEADANEAIIGISSDAAQDAPIPGSSATAAESGEQLLINSIGSVCLLEAGGTWAAGDEIKSDADGKGVTLATTGTTIQEIGAIAHTANVSGDLAYVTVFRSSRRPALS